MIETHLKIFMYSFLYYFNDKKHWLDDVLNKSVHTWQVFPESLWNVGKLRGEKGDVCSQQVNVLGVGVQVEDSEKSQQSSSVVSQLKESSTQEELNLSTSNIDGLSSKMVD